MVEADMLGETRCGLFSKWSMMVERKFFMSQE